MHHRNCMHTSLNVQFKFIASVDTVNTLRLIRLCAVDRTHWISRTEKKAEAALPGSSSIKGKISLWNWEIKDQCSSFPEAAAREDSAAAWEVGIKTHWPSQLHHSDLYGNRGKLRQTAENSTFTHQWRGLADTHYNAEYADSGRGFLNLNDTVLGAEWRQQALAVNCWRQLVCTRARSRVGIEHSCVEQCNIMQ